jgi:SAM-dependent methyltransferase
MFTESAGFYDAIYGSWKDYDGEAAAIVELLRQYNPGAKSVLDVACGTGERARILRTNHGFLVDGIDVDPAMVALARDKVREATFTEADMTDFDLGRRYDAVVCLFSSIGYARTLEGVTAAFSCFRRHLNPNGIVLVEPWFAPDGLTDGYVTVRTAEVGDRRICRMTHNEVDGKVSRLQFEYLVGDADGIRRMRETHELGLFTESEMLQAFNDAGLEASFDPEGTSGRGMYRAVPIGDAKATGTS